jgi:hypothetical protein
MDESNSIVNSLTSKVFGMIASEINKDEMQLIIKQKIITPVINMIYLELHPYIICLVATVSVILILSLLTFLFFIIYYFRKL